MIFKEEISAILNTLISNGYKAYVVGGAVRDFMMGESSYDIDITTNASTNVIKLLFDCYPLYEIGKELGTVSLIVDKYKIDITPFRKEGIYSNHRRPDFVEFSDNLEDDLSRRDFTINAICVNDNEIIDLYHGQDDIQNKIIRTIGIPNERFKEDALRILRAIRFKAKLGFVIEKETNDALFKEKGLLCSISSERKKEELLKILCYKNSYSIINEFLPIFNTFISINNVDSKIDNFNKPLYKLAYLLNDEVISELKDLSFSKHEINLLKALYKLDKINLEDEYMFICAVSDEIYREEILEYLEEYHQCSLKEKFDLLRPYIVSLNDLAVSGVELIEYGYNGKEIQKIKKELLDKIHGKVLKNQLSDIKEYLNSK